jgi:hypothetical protein
MDKWMRRTLPWPSRFRPLPMIFFFRLSFPFSAPLLKYFLPAALRRFLPAIPDSVRWPVSGRFFVGLTRFNYGLLLRADAWKGLDEDI